MCPEQILENIIWGSDLLGEEQIYFSLLFIAPPVMKIQAALY
jgi:hypothetical protein